MCNKNIVHERDRINIYVVRFDIVFCLDHTMLRISLLPFSYWNVFLTYSHNFFHGYMIRGDNRKIIISFIFQKCNLFSTTYSVVNHVFKIPSNLISTGWKYSHNCAFLSTSTKCNNVPYFCTQFNDWLHFNDFFYRRRNCNTH